MFKDTVFINSLSATAITGKDAWNRPTPQPITISAVLKTDFHEASRTDNLKYSLNYAVICRNISEFMRSNEHKNFKSMGNIAESVAEVVLDEKKGGGVEAEISVTSTKSEIRSNSIEYKLSRSTLPDFVAKPDEIHVNGLKLLTIIGVFTFERLKKQLVDIDLSLSLQNNSSIAIHDVIDEVTQYVESSNFKTVEALVLKIGQLIFQKFPQEGILTITATVTKPNAITYTEGVGVASSDMTPESFADMEPIELCAMEVDKNSFNLPTFKEDETITKKLHTAYIAFGSNQGNQLENIETAISLLKTFDIETVATSSLYLSKPMYYKDQDDFYNGVIKVQFHHKTPHELLKVLKEIEYDHINRVKEFDNGPRSIDLDILLYDNISINTADLVIPHKSMLERTFVLQPLCEVIPPEFIHPVSAEPIHQHCKHLILSNPNDVLQESAQLLQVIPVPRFFKENLPHVFAYDQVEYNLKTTVMGIFNATPDSFSDGGENYQLNDDDIRQTALQLIQSGADIIDIGGVSTRPGSKEPSEQEELDRVIPVIKAIRASKDSLLQQVTLSVDTYRANVAEKSLLSGADIINDISMGLYEPQIFDVVAKYGCPYIMNHTRGTPQTMSKLTHYESNMNEDIIEYFTSAKTGQQEYVNDPKITNLVNGVSRELALQILQAFKAGVKKWQIILDPGIGFAKNIHQNLIILKHASDFKNYALCHNETDLELNETSSHYVSFNGLPTLLGPSRKKFLGTICNETEASHRLISTAASIMACVEQHTNIVRVHDVKEMKKVCLTGDAIYHNIY